MDVGEELQVCLEKPVPYVPESSGKGRNRSRYVIEEKKLSLKNLVEDIEESEWQSIKYREGTKGKLVREAFLKKVWIWKKGTAEVEETKVLTSRKTDKTEVKYSFCEEPNKELKVEIALFRQMQRYWIERGFQAHQRANRVTSISSARVESVASSHCADDDGVAFHFGNTNRKCRKLAVNVVRRCQIDARKYP
jgi:hypothetical protein